MSTIILYDLPSRDPLHAWSPNPWKTRLVLNYKNIEYVTMWTEYPEIAPTFKNVGIPPNKEGTAYTIPVLRFPRSSTSEPQWVMESRAIVTALEKECPSPPLYLSSPILPKVEALMLETMVALQPVCLPRIPRDILNERSTYYFNKTREERFGMPLDEFEKSKNGREKTWENAVPHLGELAQTLKENGGPFFMGKTVSYADFIVVGFLQFLKRLSYDDDLFGRVMQINPSFLVLYEACAEWLKRDNY